MHAPVKFDSALHYIRKWALSKQNKKLKFKISDLPRRFCVTKFSYLRQIERTNIIIHLQVEKVNANFFAFKIGAVQSYFRVW